MLDARAWLFLTTAMDLHDYDELKRHAGEINQYSKDSYHTLLIKAIISGDIKMVTFLLSDLRADPNLKSKNGLYPLHFSTLSNDSDPACQILLSHGADPNVIDPEGKTPLFYAVEQERSWLIPVLLKAGGDPNIPEKRRGWTPLHYAVVKRKFNEVDRLLQAHNLDIDKMTRNGMTALDLSSERGYYSISNRLSKRGASRAFESVEPYIQYTD